MSWVLVLVMAVLLSEVGEGVDVVGHRPEQGVEAGVTLLRLKPVTLDPLGHQVKHLGFEVHRVGLGGACAADEPGVLQHPQVFVHSLDGDVVGLCQFADRGVGDSQACGDVTAGGIGQGGEHPRQRVSGHDGSLQPIGLTASR